MKRYCQENNIIDVYFEKVKLDESQSIGIGDLHAIVEESKHSQLLKDMQKKLEDIFEGVRIGDISKSAQEFLKSSMHDRVPMTFPELRLYCEAEKESSCAMVKFCVNSFLGVPLDAKHDEIKDSIDSLAVRYCAHVKAQSEMAETCGYNFHIIRQLWKKFDPEIWNAVRLEPLESSTDTEAVMGASEGGVPSRGVPSTQPDVRPKARMKKNVSESSEKERLVPKKMAAASSIWGDDSKPLTVFGENIPTAEETKKDGRVELVSSQADDVYKFYKFFGMLRSKLSDKN